MQMWRNRQTRWIQVPVVATPCGFKSHHLHQIKGNGVAVPFYFLCKGLEPNRTTVLIKRFSESFLAGEICESKRSDRKIQNDFVLFITSECRAKH